MNDPRVTQLRFRLETAPEVEYDSPPAEKYETALFKATLENGLLAVTPKGHYATEADAVEAVRNDVRAWEISVGLEIGLGYLSFIFEGAEIQDQDPSGTATNLSSSIGLGITGKAVHQIVKSQYPAAPSQFTVTPIVNAMWHRFSGYLKQAEPLSSMGYFCLSIVQADSGGRCAASRKYRIHQDKLKKDQDVLRELGRLTSEVGDSLTARKIDQNSTRTPHTEKEVAWILAAIKMLIRRVAEYPTGASATVNEVTMADLPSMT